MNRKKNRQLAAKRAVFVSRGRHLLIPKLELGTEGLHLVVFAEKPQPTKVKVVGTFHVPST